MTDLAKFELNNNPFRISPTAKKNELIWVGMQDLQKKIDERIDLCTKTSPSRLVLNWGKYGSGKTHAANFYTNTDYIKEKFGKTTKNIKVSLPRSSKNPVQTFLRALVGQLNFNNIISDFVKFSKEFGDNAENLIDENTNDSIIAQYLKLFIQDTIVENTSLFGNLSRSLNHNAMRDFLYGDITKGTLKELNLPPLGLDDDEQIVNLISGIFNIISLDKKLYQGIFLWIDEFEDIDTLPKINQDRFTTFLRQLIDKCPNNLTVLLNFTVKGVGEFEDLSIVLGEALNSRVAASIVFDEPTLNEAINYVHSLLNHKNYRISSVVSATKPFFPFTEEAIRETLMSLGRLSIRKINETLSLILELSLYSEQNPDEISWAFIKNISGEVPSLKIVNKL